MLKQGMDSLTVAGIAGQSSLVMIRASPSGAG
jgi:hypothetical protein